jgi:UDPglucose 6-dehydrogenase
MKNQKKISVIGTGYVGLVTAVCFAQAGHDVLCFDVDKKKISKLRKGVCPIFEPQLEDLLKVAIKKKKINFTSHKNQSANHGLFQFLCVGTPQSLDGSPNLKYIREAIKGIADNSESRKIIINKSTVPVGMTDIVREIVQNQSSCAERNIHIDVVSNPEFLREGSAVNDFLFPDRVVIGSENNKVKKEMLELYLQAGIPKKKVLFMSEKSAELTKYAANAFLATKISFINEIANLSEALGADIKEVSNGIGSDERIGKSFLNAGCGYGGSCFPKDIDALMNISKNQANKELKILKEVRTINNNQKNLLFKKLKKSYKGNIKGLKIGVWGLAFKPNTDDVRESPSIDIIENLLSSGAKVYVHDPEAMNEFKKIIKSPNLKYCNKISMTTRSADALILVTDWEDYVNYDFSKENMKMNNMKIFDGRLCLNKRNLINMGYEYISIGI